jgi:hypothetical protein
VSTAKQSSNEALKQPNNSSSHQAANPSTNLPNSQPFKSLAGQSIYHLKLDHHDMKDGRFWSGKKLTIEKAPKPVFRHHEELIGKFVYPHNGNFIGYNEILKSPIW